ncbi:UTRA domain-containing protein [Streptomyces antimycoticus]
MINLIGDNTVRLREALRTAIAKVNDLHRDTCALDQGAVPASTAVMIRERDDVLEYLVLSDNVLVLDLGDNGIQTVTDKRVEEVASDEMRAALQGPTGTPEHAARVSELVTVQRSLRNRPGGYWVAATDPAAADEAITGTVDLAKVRQAALLTDGASRLVDSFGALSWEQLLDLLRTEGPAALIARTREAELADPVGERWPRFKRSDDASAAYVRIGQPVPLSSGTQRVERRLKRPERQKITRSRQVYRDEKGYFFDPTAQGWVALQTPTVRWGTVPVDLAPVLGVAIGDEVLIRDRIMGDPETGEAKQLATSYLPSDISRGTQLAERDTGEGGIYDRLEGTGHRPLKWSESVSARMPSPEEAETLGLPTDVGVPLLRLVRVTTSPSGRVVEVNDTRMSAEDFEVGYDIQRSRSAQLPRSDDDST